ncbi:hypothetical protein BOX15_Mlig024726g2, partial [Macrostomum lignano]
IPKMQCRQLLRCISRSPATSSSSCFGVARRQIHQPGGFDTSFGFEEVEPGQKQDRVNQVFNRVSNSYDVMNDLMSAGLHRCWKRRFVASANPRPGWRVVDVAGGTGDIALGLLEWSRKLPGRAPPPVRVAPGDGSVDSFREAAERQTAAAEAEAPAGCTVSVVDPSPSMMQVGSAKASAKGSTFASSIQWLEGRAESLPLDEASSDLYTIAFGMRNCTDLPGVLREAHRVLKPYGRFACLEFCSVENPLLSILYDEYSFRVIPPMGLLVAGDWDSYEYLVESIRRFPHQTLFANMMREAGFSAVNYEVLWPGVCCIHSGYKLPSVK